MMGRTIIQPIGPLYGEAVNGTVFGRPNGSIYVPTTNLISISLGVYGYIKAVGGGRIRMCNSSGTDNYGQEYGISYVAQAQDQASYIQLQIYEDSDCETVLCYRNMNAGDFNNWVRDLTTIVGTVVNGTTYYLRAQLMNNGVPVATSSVIEVTGWASE